MFRRHLAILIAVLIALPCLAADLALPFEVNASRGAIFVHGKVNGKDAVFLLDTGACCTIVDASLVSILPMDLKLARLNRTGPGLAGEGKWVEAHLQMGAKTWKDRRLVAMNLDNMSRLYGRRVQGLIGHDLLSEFDRVVIDFESRRLILSD